MQFGGKDGQPDIRGTSSTSSPASTSRATLRPTSERTQKSVAPYMTFGPCPLCKGTRLVRPALSCKINGRNIAELSSMEVAELIDVIKAIKDPEAAPIVATLTERLQHLIDIGLEYLSLNRETDTLSGGESQRIKIVKHLGSSLVDVMYIFDEPSIGLHPRDVHRMNELLQKLRDKGNTVIVVEHDPDVIKIADHVVDVGPLAGSAWRQDCLRRQFRRPAPGRHADGQAHEAVDAAQGAASARRQANWPSRHAKVNNLQNVSVDIPTGVLTVVTGVAGSGKSSLINEAFLRQHPECGRDRPIRGGRLDPLQSRHVHRYHGRCPQSLRHRQQSQRVVVQFQLQRRVRKLSGAWAWSTPTGVSRRGKNPCEVCGGKRFKDEVLAYKLNGKSITDVLAMSVGQALEYFELKEVVRKLQAMSDVGLDYLTLGQPLSTLSGGECQRIKLASELHKKGSIYVMDEPTTGLHMSDIGHLLRLSTGWWIQATR